jgi:aminoacylase
VRRLLLLTTLALTSYSYLKAGVTADGRTFSMNVVPPEAEAGFDVRIPPHVDLPGFRAWLDALCSAEPGVSWQLVPGSKPQSLSTPLGPTNRWWLAAQGFFQTQAIPIEPEIFPAGTDAVFLRNQGYPAFGFSPIRRSPVLLHCNDERLHRDVFLEGIRIYMGLIPALANLTAEGMPPPPHAKQ